MTPSKPALVKVHCVDNDLQGLYCDHGTAVSRDHGTAVSRDHGTAVSLLHGRCLYYNVKHNLSTYYTAAEMSNYSLGNPILASHTELLAVPGQGRCRKRRQILKRRSTYLFLYEIRDSIKLLYKYLTIPYLTL